MSESDQKWGGEDPERLYILTKGRDGLVGGAPLDLVTLIVSRGRPEPGMAPEHSAIMQLCEAPLSVAEISAYLHLPVSVVTVILGELLAREAVEARAPLPAALLPDIALIEAVMHGLQKL